MQIIEPGKDQGKSECYIKVGLQLDQLYERHSGNSAFPTNPNRSHKNLNFYFHSFRNPSANYAKNP
jgi:hypothetical protein